MKLARYVKEYGNSKKRGFEKAYKTFKNPYVLDYIKEFDKVYSLVERDFIGNEEAIIMLINIGRKPSVHLEWVGNNVLKSL